MSRPRPIAGIALSVWGVVILALGAWSLFGLPIWMLLTAAAMPWFWLLASRFGGLLATATVLLAALWLLLVTMMGTSATGMPMMTTIVVIAVLLGLGGGFACRANATALRLPARCEWAFWSAPLAGAVAWAVAMIVAAVHPGSGRYSWVMLGDAANNVIFAREIIYRGGIGLGPDANPVPLPSALAAIMMASGRDGLPAAAETAHDLAAFSMTWALLIMLSCYVIGLTAAAVARQPGISAWVPVVVGAGASVLPLSWFFTGYPLEYGFFNTHVTYPVVMAAFLAFLAAERRPALALAAQAFAGTLLLAIWSPLVLMPAALALAILVRHWRAIWRWSGASSIVLVVAIVQLALYGVLVVLPSLLAQGKFLSAPGGAFGFERWTIVAIGVVPVVAAPIAAGRIRNWSVLGAVLMVAASLAGLGALLVVAQAGGNAWSYYPLKFLWLACAILLVLAIGYAAAALARLARRAWLTAIALALLAGGTWAFLDWTPLAAPGYQWMNPAERMVRGHFIGTDDHAAEVVMEYARLDEPHVLWRSGDPAESSINFWLLQLWGNSMTENIDIKYYAYGVTPFTEPDELCSLAEHIGQPLAVHTSDADAARQAEAVCGTSVSIVSVPEGGL